MAGWVGNTIRNRAVTCFGFRRNRCPCKTHKWRRKTSEETLDEGLLSVPSASTLERNVRNGRLVIFMQFGYSFRDE